MEQKTKETLTAAAIGAGVLGVIGAAVAGVDGMNIDAIEKILDFDKADIIDMAEKPQELADNIKQLTTEDQLKYTGGYVLENANSEAWYSGITTSIGNGASFLGDGIANLFGADGAGGIVVHIPGTEEAAVYTQEQYAAALEAAKDNPEMLSILEKGINAIDSSPEITESASKIKSEEVTNFLESNGGNITNINSFFPDDMPDNLTRAELPNGNAIIYNTDLVKTNAAELATKLNEARGDLSIGAGAGIGAVAGAGAGALMAMTKEPSHADRVRPNGPQGADWSQVMQQQQAMLQNAYANRG